MFGWFRRKKSAKTAKERLQIAIMSDRASSDYPFMEDLKRDIIEVIKKYKKVSNVEIKRASEKDINAISIDVELE